MITVDQLAQATGCTRERAATWCAPIVAAMALFGVSSLAQQTAFLAQIAHESGRFVYTRELWGPTPEQARYEGRADLGNTQPGDGFRYRGRGLIQVTGRANYAAARDALRRLLPDAPDFEASPELLELPRWAAMSAGWFWQSHGCGVLADAGDFVRLTRRINGGTNGLADRTVLWAGAKAALGTAA